MANSRVLTLLLLCCFSLLTAGLALRGRPGALIKPYKRDLLQDIVRLADTSPICFNFFKSSP